MNSRRSKLDALLGPVPDLPTPEGLNADRRAAVILWSAAILMVLLVFRAGFPTPASFNPEWSGFAGRSLGAKLYWASWGFLFYLLIPCALILLVFRESPARYGLRIYLTPRTALAYGVLLAAMLLPLYWASTQEAFLRKYPFVTDLGNDMGRIALWEAVYLSRFIALEFFFRGYMLFGLEEKLGTMNAVAVSVIPYAILHYAKPFPEAMGSIAAGLVLGVLALRTRSIVGGAILHIAIAFGMDALALWKKGAFG